MSGVTTIQIKPATREKLALRGKKGQSYDEIIQELLKMEATA